MSVFPGLPLGVSHSAPPWGRAGQQLPYISSGDPGGCSPWRVGGLPDLPSCSGPPPKASTDHTPREAREAARLGFFTNEKMEA